MATVSLLLSGGIDLMVVLHLLLSANRTVSPNIVDYGQAALAHERVASKEVASHYNLSIAELIVSAPAKAGAGEIRHRNGLLVFAAAMCGAPTSEAIAIGVHAGVPYADCSLRFLENQLEKTLEFSSDQPMHLIAPLKSWSKPEIIAFAKQQALPIHLTYSCGGWHADFLRRVRVMP